ncbi:MAG: class I SAM-dependent methyltransferase [Galbitalea sp.]
MRGPSIPRRRSTGLCRPARRPCSISARETGKLTRALSARGLEVFAVDPSPQMLAQLAAAVPGAIAFAGTAEDIPLADASVDAVLVGQAWHWVDQDAALRSVERVLRPGGTLGLVWNLRDESVPWVARLTAVIHAAMGEDVSADRDDSSGSLRRNRGGDLRLVARVHPRRAVRPGALAQLLHHGAGRGAGEHPLRQSRRCSTATPTSADETRGPCLRHACLPDAAAHALKPFPVPRVLCVTHAGFLCE